VRLANLDGSLLLLTSDTEGIDVAAASDGRFGPAPQAVFDDWTEFAAWAAGLDPATAPTVPVDPRQLSCPSPQARQVFGIGLNYKLHAAESGFPLPDVPPVFTKFAGSLAGPFVEVELPAGGHTDWEAELVVVIGRQARHVAPEHAWEHVAGIAIGQDISERIRQMADPTKQFSLGKSFPNFGPFGPWLVTPDEFGNPDDIEIGCSIDGVVMQQTRTSDMIFSVPALVAHLSAILPLLPGDVLFTGTPGGVGLGMSPQRWLQPGETLVSWAEGVGSIEQTFVAAG
jgi:2-keto-4-pentenoate hydratase/2-oxohepta-3-ene-1,7-dioic acid hydratase in catechol pathway